MKQVLARLVVVGVAAVLLAGGPAPGPKMGPKAGPKAGPKGGAKFAPRQEAVAETKLLMEALAYANFRGLEGHLTQKPADVQAWTYARGQALLLAETANLLMLRPPRQAGQAAWFERANDLRQQAKQLAVALGQRDYAASRAGLTKVAASCTRCHQTFRVDVELTPFATPAPPKVE